MRKISEFLERISKTGWIIVSLVIIVILLVIIGILLERKGVDLWPFNNGSNPEVTLKEVELGEENEDLLAQVDRALQSAEDSVLSVEDVLAGMYDNSVESATVFVQNTREVQIAVVIEETEYQIANTEETDCGKLAFVTVRVPDKPGIINETLKAIFANKIKTDFKPGNVIPLYHPGIVFDKAVLENGVAKIYLRGEFGEAEEDNCGKELVIKQLEATVAQFDTVNSVEIYQNLQKVN
jgi:hypothetical protein